MGDSIVIGGETLTVSGVGCLPDYGYVKQNVSDVDTNEEFSVACYGSISNYINGIADDIHCNYMYILRNPVSDLPKNAQVGHTRSFNVDYAMTGGEMEVTLLGIDRDNPYFDFAAELSDDSNKIYMSDSVRIKFGYKIGDKAIFTDGSEDKMYAFEIADEVKYGNGLYFFMNTDAMRKAFGLPYFNEDDLKKGARPPKSSDYYYNTVFSDKKLTFKHNMMIIVGIIMLSYVLTRAFLVGYLKKIKLTEILKNRE